MEEHDGLLIDDFAFFGLAPFFFFNLKHVHNIFFVVFFRLFPWTVSECFFFFFWVISGVFFGFSFFFFFLLTFGIPDGQKANSTTFYELSFFFWTFLLILPTNDGILKQNYDILIPRQMNNECS